MRVKIVQNMSLLELFVILPTGTAGISFQPETKVSKDHNLIMILLFDVQRYIQPGDKWRQRSCFKRESSY